MRQWIVPVLVFSLASIPAPAGTLGGFGDIGAMTRWEATGCTKPRAPFTFKPDVDAFNRYIDQVNAYTDCVYREASDDIMEATSAIKSGARRAEEDVLRESEYARTSLQQQLRR